MRVAFFPDTYRQGNPYLELLAGGLKAAGVEVIPLNLVSPYNNWLLKNRSKVDVLHFHWISPMYVRPTLSSSSYAFIRFASRVILARLLGFRIVWTMHNLYPHENEYSFLNKLARYLMIWAAQSIIVHCQQAHKDLVRVFHRHRAIYIIPLGKYPRLSSHIVNPEETKRKLGIPKEHLLFFSFGQIRPYKGLDNLIDSFKKLSNKDISLLISGNTRFHGFAQELKLRAKQEPRIHLEIRWIMDEELHEFLLSSDIVVLPFREITTSSTAMLAFSYSKPVIAPRLGCLPELIDNQTGFLYDPKNPKGFFSALQESLQKRAELKLMGEKAGHKADDYSWDRIGTMTAKIYRGEPID